jgi:phosphopantetheinyl transferase
MIWLSSAHDLAATLPASWLIATGQAPRNLDERSALRRTLARDVLCRQLGKAFTIGHEAGGRPFLIGLPDLHISLATRSGVVAIALARSPVGIDVEALSDGPHPVGMLHASEGAMLGALPASDRNRAFTQLWAAKEAYVKALGTGFLREPDSFAVEPSGERFRIDDRQRPTAARGWLRAVSLPADSQKNGDQDKLAAAVIVLA